MSNIRFEWLGPLNVHGIDIQPVYNGDKNGKYQEIISLDVNNDVNENPYYKFSTAKKKIHDGGIYYWMTGFIVRVHYNINGIITFLEEEINLVKGV